MSFNTELARYGAGASAALLRAACRRSERAELAGVEARLACVFSFRCQGYPRVEQRLPRRATSFPSESRASRSRRATWTRTSSAHGRAPSPQGTRHSQRTDTADAPRVAVVNQALANLLLAGESAVWAALPCDADGAWIEIVGVVRPDLTSRSRKPPRSFMYLPVCASATESNDARHAIERRSATRSWVRCAPSFASSIRISPSRPFARWSRSTDDSAVRGLMVFISAIAAMARDEPDAGFRRHLRPRRIERQPAHARSGCAWRSGAIAAQWFAWCWARRFA